MKTNCGIYKITINNKIYVGSSVNLKSRRWKHLSLLRNGNHHNKHLQSAYNKYQDFNWNIVEYVNKIEDRIELKNVLMEREQYWMDEYNVCDKSIGYNKCTKAYNPVGIIMSEQTKIKISIKLKKYFSIEENRNKLSKSLKGRIVTEETKKKLSESLRGRVSPMKGRKPSEETRKKISEANKKRWDKSLEERNLLKLYKKSLKVGRRRKTVNVDNGEVFNSVSEAARCYSINKSHIAAVCRGERKTAGGYIWRYI
jgi:group I intron endonuclease